MHVAPHGSQFGLTMIEILVALLVVSIVSVLGYQALDGVLRARDRQVDTQQELAAVQRALLLLEGDLLHLRARPVRDPFGDLLPAYRVPAGIDLVQLTRGGLPPAAGIAGGLQRVAYRIEDGTLARSSWPVVDRIGTAGASAQPLLDGVRELRLEQLDPLNFWVPVWPPLNEAMNPDQLPRMIRLQLTLEDGRQFEKLLPGLDPVIEGGS